MKWRKLEQGNQYFKIIVVLPFLFVEWLSIWDNDYYQPAANQVLHRGGRSLFPG